MWEIEDDDATATAWGELVTDAEYRSDTSRTAPATR
jgi:hypothetical protein